MRKFARALTFAIPQFALTPVLTKVVKLSPPMIGFLSASSKVSYYVIVAYASNRTMVRKNVEKRFRLIDIKISKGLRCLPDLLGRWGGQHCLQVRGSERIGAGCQKIISTPSHFKVHVG